MDERQYILNLWNESPRVATHILKSKNPKLYYQIDQIEGNSFSEKAWKWVYSRNNSCLECGCPTKFLDFRRGFAIYCSRKCVANNQTISIKKTKTNQEKYGVDHFSKTDQYKEQFKTTIFEKYGVENPGQILELKQKRARQKQLTFFNNIIDKIKEFSIPNFTFDNYTEVRDSQLSWTCKLCNVSFNSNIFGRLPKCTTCFPIGNFGGQSSIEKDILEHIRQFYNGIIIENSREIISPKELDLYFPNEKFAIEINGVYWHSDKHLSNTYHYEKFKLCNDSQITLLMITDEEWTRNKELILSMIKHRLGISKNKIFGRKCKLKEINNKLAHQFLEKYHINGYCKSSGHLGLYFNEQLVSVFSYSTKNRFKKENNEIEIIRLAFSSSVIGGLGKFISFIKQSYPGKKIITFADLRYGEGKVYEKNNFKFIKTTPPGYWYFLNGQMYHRLSWQKKNLVSLGYSKDKTEKEIMNELGAIRIYDCGHNYFELGD